ncbi:MAG: NAD-dependent epimerase/dehydratase family protein [Actinomycetes bacterium]
MRVLVTGHLGYIGAVMVPLLQDAGHDVVGLDTGFYAGSVHGPTPAPIEAHDVDLRDVGREHLEGVDAVVHLAALSNDPLGDLAPEHTHEINHHASTRLARLAKEAGVQRFLYSSSCSVYGAADTSALVDETAPLNPVSAYAVSKVAVEGELTALADDGFHPTSLRNATAYGWSPRLRTDLVLNDLVASAVRTGEVLVLSDGTPWRPLVHIEDISRAFLAVLEAPVEVVHDRAFNVGSAADNHRVADLAEIVADAVPGSDVRITGENGGDPRSYRVSFERITEELPAFAPAWDAAAGAAELRDAYLAHGLDEHQHKVAHRRLGVLRQLLDAGALDAELRWTDRRP